MCWFTDVLDFHKKLDSHIGTTPSIPPPQVQELRQALEQEELSELWQAHSKEDLVEIADAIVDSIYVLIGRAISYGIDLRPIWDEVHKSNMAKAGGGKREDGKRLKPPGWQPPKIAELLDKQIPLQQPEQKNDWVKLMNTTTIKGSAG